MVNNEILVLLKNISSQLEQITKNQGVILSEIALLRKALKEFDLPTLVELENSISKWEPLLN